MKKVAIITLCGNYNYGNKLQNYALQEILKKYDCNVSTIWIYPYGKFSRGHKIEIKHSIKDFINYIFARNRRFHFTNTFKSFNHKYIKYYHKKVYSFKEDKIKKFPFDKYVIGSDQIWNFDFPNDNFGKIEFALPVPKEKCFSYAASFGVSKIPKKLYSLYSNGLNHLSRISVREDSGVDLVKELSGRNDAKLVLDPTLLLSSADWDKISKKPHFLDNDSKYILTYFLGAPFDNNYIRMIAKEKKYRIININKNSCYFYEIGPSEFVYLLKNAKMVLTDSFHACCFSIIYNIPFYVFDRKDAGKSMNSRINSLLSRYSLEDRKIKEIDDMSFSKLILSKKAKEVLKNDIEYSNRYIEDSLK